MSKLIAVINGPNLNLLGTRLPEVYGSTTLHGILASVETLVKSRGGQLESFQSNSEGALIDYIQDVGTRAAGIIINPAAYSHTSIALRDALETLSIPIIEVHLSNIFAREEFRRHSYVSELAAGVICGLGAHGYILAAKAMLKIIDSENK